MQNSWTKIKNELTKVSSDIGSSFNKPASNKQITLLETALKQTLPDSFKEYLMTFNGQQHENYSTFFIGHNCLLNVKEIIDTWKMQMDLFGDEEEIDWVKENKVRPVIWDKSWIPFTDFEATTRIAIDLNPGKNGTYGQILQIHAGQDLETDNIVISRSFEDFSKEILKRLTKKNYEYKNGIIEFIDNWLV
jgi:cell wall assembly regulator SMI1